MLKIPLFVLVTIVATLNLSLAQSQNDPSSDDHQTRSPSFFGLPFPFPFPPFMREEQVSSDSEERRRPVGFGLHLPHFREEQASGPPADASDADQASSERHDQDHQDRFFFGLFHPASTLVACNYTTQGGARCTSCTTALTCGSGNVGRQRVCRGFFPYCNLGRCSPFPGELCSNTSNSGNSNASNSTG